ncbi:MAG: NADH-quinone oxidoreductase subunit C [Gammaproteobacteria bacterium]|nr:NADH-quinone oxidoreductase subunit C [Gammaproteobacteria bacterium]
MQALYHRLKALFPLGELTEQRENLVFVTVDAAHLRSLLLQLRDIEGFTHLVLLTAVDWIETGEFQLTYLLGNRAKRQDIGVRVMLSREQATMATIHDLWPTAATYQRELREMFGIDFPQSPGVNEEFILEGWNDIPPYRRDFNTLDYAEATYNDRPGRESRDPATYMREKLYGEGH